MLLLSLASFAGCASTPLNQPDAVSPPSRELRTHFLKFCNLAAAEFSKELAPFPFRNREYADPGTHHMPFFEDAHAVRALAVAYDLTGQRSYLDACRRWCDQMLAYQERMIPAGAYYMNHQRAPGENTGQWNVADSGSIAMAVLATAVRCKDAAEKGRYLRSVRAFADLVIGNYLTPSGGITNGLWPQYDGPWWCSTATFGSLAFLLYDETGDKKFLDVGLSAVRWLGAQDFRRLGPITFEQRPSGTIFYCFELYATGLRYLDLNGPQYTAILPQFDAALTWMREHQKSLQPAVPDYTTQNVDMAGLPYLMLAFARQVPRYRNLVPAADEELRYIGHLLLDHGTPNVSRLLIWEVMTWGMMSYAERLSPGGLHRSSALRIEAAGGSQSAR